MDIQAVGTFALLVLLLTMVPGPNTALILKSVPQNGRRGGVLHLAGIVAAFYLHGLFSILGLSALILKTSQAFFVLKLLGFLYLLYLGVTSIWKACYVKRRTAEGIIGKGKFASFRGNRLFFEGFFTNLLNPKAAMFYLAVFPQFIRLEGNPVFESLVLVGIHSIVVILWFSFMIIALGRITRALSSGKFKRIVQGATGVLMVWFGYRLLTYQQKG